MIRPSRDILIGFVLICALALGMTSQRAWRVANLHMLDREMSVLRAIAPRTPAQDVVVIGLDEAAYESIPEPFALWHRHLGELFTGLAAAKPGVVGLAMPLPVRSYDFMVKDIDAPLVAGLKRLAAAAPLVVGQGQSVGNTLRPIAPELLAAAGKDNVASLVLCEDSDGVVRRINHRRCATLDKHAAFAEAVARHLGRDSEQDGLIDFNVGGEISYLPLRQVLDWIRQGRSDELQRNFAGRAVVIASLLPNETRYRLPFAISAWERGNRSQPAAVAHIQALRSLLDRGLIERTSSTLGYVLAILCALLWFGHNGIVKASVLAGTLAALLLVSTYLLWQGSYLPIGGPLATALFAFAARLAYESIGHYREKQALRSAFAGHVSPQVMRAILKGQLQPEAAGELCQVTILFADIRGFTSRAESATPEATIALLNRFYAEAAAAIHSRGGAIDKYIGDGLMATFGMPQPLPAPERNALEAAQDLLTRIERVNVTLAAEGLAPLQIGVGIHSGEVLAGYVGSRKRRDFTVIGDPVNTASRLEGMTKEVGYPVVCSHEVAAAVGFAGGLEDLGERPVKGHTAMHVWGWNPPLSKRLKGDDK